VVCIFGLEVLNYRDWRVFSIRMYVV
jgi:hypothetical protein